MDLGLISCNGDVDVFFAIGDDEGARGEACDGHLVLHLPLVVGWDVSFAYLFACVFVGALDLDERGLIL